MRLVNNRRSHLQICSKLCASLVSIRLSLNQSSVTCILRNFLTLFNSSTVQSPFAMRSLTLSLSCLIVLIVAITFVHGEMSCKEAVNDLTKRQLKGVQECTKQMKFKNAKEKAKKMTCVMKCVLMNEGIMGADGTPDPISVLAFVELNFPRSTHVWVREVIMGCLDTASLIDPKEETCKSYDPMIKCSLSGLNLFCNPPSK